MDIVMQNIPPRHAAQHGFSLIELSIVLIVMVVLAGGILAGKSMMDNASVRATIIQLEKYQSAINAFRNKYEAVPGDFLASQAASYGLITRTGADAHGDGDFILESCSSDTAFSASRGLGCETALFWSDLSATGLIEGNFPGASDALLTLADGAQSTAVPKAKVTDHQNFIIAYGYQGQNYLQVAGISSVTAGVYSLANSLTPVQAWRIDDKFDDGLPSSGNFVIRIGTSNPVQDVEEAGGGSGTCYTTDGTKNIYYTSDAAATTPACRVRVAFN